MVPEWVLVLFAAGGVALLAAFWVWTTRNRNKKK